MDGSTPGFPVLHHLLEFAQTHVHWVSDAIQLSHPLLPSSPAFNLSQHQGLFQWVSSSHWVAKILELQYQSFHEYSRMISFRIDWFDLRAVQGTLKSLLQHHSLKASILRCSVFFIFQLSHPYMTTGKAIALTRWTFVDKVMPLLFNTSSRFVIAFFPRSKRLLISWLQPVYTVTLEPRKIKSVVNLHYYSSICKVLLLFTNLPYHFIICNFLVMPSIPLLFFKHIKQTHLKASVPVVSILSDSAACYLYSLLLLVTYLLVNLATDDCELIFLTIFSVIKLWDMFEECSFRKLTFASAWPFRCYELGSLRRRFLAWSFSGRARSVSFVLSCHVWELQKPERRVLFSSSFQRSHL